MSLDSLQQDFDRFVLSSWKFASGSCGSIQLKFAIRCGVIVEDDATPYQTAHGKLRDLGLKRIPPDSYSFAPIGAWLMAAYPEFFDRIAKTKDVMALDLSTMRYVAKLPLMKQYQTGTSRRKQQVQADLTSHARSMVKAHQPRKGSENKLSRR